MATRTPKVLITINWPERLGGAEAALWSFLRHADRERMEPVVVFHGRGGFEREVAALGIPTRTIPLSRLRQAPRTAANVGRLLRILQRERPALVLNWLPKAQLYGGAAALLAGMGARNAWLQHDFPDGRVADRLAAALPSVAVIACSRAVAEEQARLVPRRPTLAVYPGVEEPRLPGAEEVRSLRRSLGLPEDSVVLGIVGRLMPWKGQDRFLEALALLRRRGHPVHGLVVGGNAYDLAPGYDVALRRRADALGVREAVTFTGQVSSATDCLPLIDVLVNAAEREPFGIALVEAMAAGVAVAAVGAGGPREIVEDGRSGVLAASGTPAQLADAIEPLVRDPGLRARLAAGGRERYAARFTAERAARELEDVLEGLIGPPPR